MTITREQLTKLFNEFYGTRVKDILDIPQDAVKYKKGKFPVLFLDEYSRANRDIKNATLQLLLDKKLHNHILPHFGTERTQIILADNPDNGEYDVEPLDPASLDRVAVFEVEHDVSGWLQWARAKKLAPVVIDYITNNPDKLYYMPKDPTKTSATPRSWAKLGEYLREDKGDRTYAIIKSKIGDEIGAQFYIFYQNYSNAFTLSDVKAFVENEIKNGENDPKVIGEKLIEVINEKEVESSTKLEMLKALEDEIREIVNDDNTSEIDAGAYYAMLYGLEAEIVASYLKELKEKDFNFFLKVVRKREDKRLMRRLTDLKKGK